MNDKARARGGFTLSELLVVVGIVAMIAAILFPVFAAVRERGRRTVCQSNLKQIAIAMQQYVQDNDGVYPSSSNWGYAPYLYLKSTVVFRCPDHPKQIQDLFSTNPLPSGVGAVCILADSSTCHPVDYSYNSSQLYLFLPKTKYGVQDTALGSSSTIWLNVDPVWKNPNGTLIDPNGDSYGRLALTSCSRDFVGSTLHSGAGNYSYIDGHVKWLTPEEAGEIECANGPLPAPFKD